MIEYAFNGTCRKLSEVPEGAAVLAVYLNDEEGIIWHCRCE